jgi:hypothetical protein
LLAKKQLSGLVLGSSRATRHSLLASHRSAGPGGVSPGASPPLATNRLTSLCTASGSSPKLCRYAAEAVALVVGRPATRLAAAVEEIQTILGEHQDTVVAEAWLRQAAAAEPRTGAGAGQLIARLLARRAQPRAEWPKTWKAASARHLRCWL